VSSFDGNEKGRGEAADLEEGIESEGPPCFLLQRAAVATELVRKVSRTCGILRAREKGDSEGVHGLSIESKGIIYD
jgi:hypothetical protein